MIILGQDSKIEIWSFSPRILTHHDNFSFGQEVIPRVKGEILAGCHLVFSGLVPSHVPLSRSRAYAVAVSLGATVSAEVTAETTHLVAARAGTAKVNSSRRQKGVHIVTPQWLWHCAERWEKVDERLYPLGTILVVERQAEFTRLPCKVV